MLGHKKFIPLVKIAVWWGRSLTRFRLHRFRSVSKILGNFLFFINSHPRMDQHRLAPRLRQFLFFHILAHYGSFISFY